MQSKLSAEQLGEMSEFLAFVDQYLIDGTIDDNTNESQTCNPAAFVSIATMRWRKVKPIFDIDEEARLQTEIRILSTALESKREQFRAQRKARVL